MPTINSSSITKILDSLNEELKKSSINRELQVFGSGALMLLNISNSNRFTEDLDMLSPTGDIDLMKASEAVAKKHDLDKEWLNSIGSRFTKYFKNSWEQRLQLVYTNSNLKVLALSHSDLFIAKLKAFYNRNTKDDLEDLISFNLSLGEIDSIIEKNNFSDHNRTQEVLEIIKGEYEKNQS